MDCVFDLIFDPFDEITLARAPLGHAGHSSRWAMIVIWLRRDRKFRQSRSMGDYPMMFNTDPNRTLEEILADIQKGAVDTASSQNVNLVGNVLAPFAALLVKLSRDAATATARTERLTKRLYVTTIALLVVTFLLFVLTLGLFAKEAYDFYEKNYVQHQNPQPAQDQKLDPAVPPKGR
jgi:hypothetical protein